MGKFKTRLLLCSTGLSLAAMTVMSPGANAQEQGAADSQGDEIIVTAQFRAQNLQDTPLAITAVSAEMMEARSQTNVQEIAAQAPGLNLQPNNANFGPSMAASIRGVGQYDPSPAVEPGVGLYVDDVYYPSLTGALFDLLDLDRVEVLRGPQGTLAGRNSIGGALKLYSKRPTGSNTGLIQAAYGSRNRQDLRATFDLGVTDSLSLRVAAASKTQRGYVDVVDFGCANPQGTANNPATGGIPALRVPGDCVVDRNGDVNYQAVRGQLRFKQGAVDLMVSADYVTDDRSMSPSVLLTADNQSTGFIRGPYTNVPFDSRFICGRYCNYGTGVQPATTSPLMPYETTRPLISHYSGYGLSAHADITLSDSLQLSSITGYRAFKSRYAVDADLSPLPVNFSENDFDVKFFSQELRLNGKALDDRLNYTVGGYYSDTKTILANILDLRYSNLQFASLGDRVPAKSLAAFANISWEVIDGLTLNGGIRRTHEDKDYTFSRRFANGSTGQPRVGSLDGQTGEYEVSRWDYRANLQYAWTRDIMTYVQYSTGYKGGGVNPRPFFPDQVQPFGPESLKAWEFGLKTDLLDGRLRTNISAYYNKYKDIQLVLTSCPQFTPGNAPAPCAMTANAGDADVKGIELETTFRPVDGLLIDGSLSYIDFQYKRIAPAAAGPTGVRLTDVTPFTSDWKWSIGAQYEARIDDDNAIIPRFDIAHQSGFWAAARNEDANHVDAYTVANARLTWRNRDKDFDISLSVTNLFDKYYLLTVFDQTSGQGSISGMPARPREWSLIVTKRF